MPNYCFRCPNCDHTMSVARGFGDTRSPSCSACLKMTSRDYMTEYKSQGHFVPGYMSAKNTTSRGDFLPSAKDYERPGDTDGSKGFQEWKDTHHLKREV